MKKLSLSLFLLLSVVAFVNLSGNTTPGCKNGCFTNVTYTALNFTLPVNKWVEYCSLTPVPSFGGAACSQASSEGDYRACLTNFCPFLVPFIEQVKNFECLACLTTPVAGESRTSRIFKCSAMYTETDAAQCALRSSQDMTVLDGNWAMFRTGALVPGYSNPQWESSLVNGAPFNPISGATSPVYSLQSLLGLSGSLYRSRWTVGSNSATTIPSTLTVNPAPPGAPQLFVSNGSWYGMVEQYSAANGSFTSHFAPVDSVKGLVVNPANGALLAASENQVLSFNGHTAQPLGVFVDGSVPCGGQTLNGAAGIAFGPDSHLYVVDTGNNRVVQYDGFAGTCRGNYASGATLNRPNDLVFGRDGFLYVTNLSGSVARFSPLTGAPAGTMNVGTTPFGIAISPLDDNLYVTDQVTSGRVFRISRSAFPSAAPVVLVSNPAGGLSNPAGLVFGADQLLYVASPSNRQVQRFNGTTGALVSTFISGSASFQPTFLAFGALPRITWPTPLNIPFGSALSAGQLSASANVPGTFVYSPAAGTVLPAGNAQTLSVQFTPSLRNYRPTTATVLINVTGGGPATLVSTNTVTREPGSNNVMVAMQIANTSSSPATGVTVQTARIGSTAALTAVPIAVGTIPAGGSTTVMLTFPASVGAAGARVVLTAGGSFAGGSFGQSARVVLP